MPTKTTSYDLPFRYLKKHDCYLVTLQKGRRSILWDVVPGYGDRALPKGLIRVESDAYVAYHYDPAHAADVAYLSFAGAFTTKDEAIRAVLDTNFEPTLPLGYMQGRGAS